MSIIEGDEKKTFWSRVTKPWTESCAEKNCNDREKLSLQEGSYCKSTVRISKFCRDIMQDKLIITFQVMFCIDEDFNNSRKWKKKKNILDWSYKAVNWILCWEKLRWFSDNYHLQKCCFRKSAVRISKYFVEIMKGQSKIIFQVIFHIDGDFNNSRKWKNTVVESSFKAVNWIFCWEKMRWSSESYTVWN